MNEKVGESWAMDKKEVIVKGEVVEKEAQQVNIEDKDQPLNADMVGKNCSCLLGWRTGLILEWKVMSIEEQDIQIHPTPVSDKMMHVHQYQAT